MIRVGNSRGFTVVETVIFLTVSSALFVSAMLVVSGQQAKTEFRQAASQTQGLIDDVANDVSTGYYQSPGTTKRCQNDGSGNPGFPVSGPATSEKGTSRICVILGQAIQFGATDTLTVYPVIGFRARGVAPDLRLTQNLTFTGTDGVGANPVVFNQEGFREAFNLPGGLTIKSAVAEHNGSKTAIRGVAFVSRLGDFSGGQLQPGVAIIDVIPLGGPLTDNQDEFVSTGTESIRASTDLTKNPSGGVTVCLDSGGTNQHILLRFGAGGNPASSIEYRNGYSESDGDCSP